MDNTQEEEFDDAISHGNARKVLIFCLVVLFFAGFIGFLIGRGTAPGKILTVNGGYDYNRISQGYQDCVAKSGTLRVDEVTDDHLKVGCYSNVATTTILEEKQRCDAAGGKLYALSNYPNEGFDIMCRKSFGAETLFKETFE